MPMHRIRSIERPSTKVTSMTVASALASVIRWLAAEAGINIPGPVEEAIVVLVTLATGYIVREHNPPRSLVAAVQAGHHN